MTDPGTDAPHGQTCGPRRFIVWTWIVGGLAGCAVGTAFLLHLHSVMGLAVVPLVALPIVLATLIIRWRCRPDAIVPRRHLLMPGMALLAIMAAREGVFGETLLLDANWYRSTASVEWTSIVNKHRTTIDGPTHASGAAEPGSSVTVSVVAKSGGRGQVVDALERALREKSWSSETLTLDVTLDLSEPWCSVVPLYKSGDAKCAVTFEAKWAGTQSSGNEKGLLSATISQTMTGIASRRCFNERAANLIADRVMDTVNEAIGSR